MCDVINPMHQDNLQFLSQLVDRLRRSGWPEHADTLEAVQKDMRDTGDKGIYIAMMK